MITSVELPSKSLIVPNKEEALSAAAQLGLTHQKLADDHHIDLEMNLSRSLTIFLGSQDGGVPKWGSTPIIHFHTIYHYTRYVRLPWHVPSCSRYSHTVLKVYGLGIWASSC